MTWYHRGWHAEGVRARRVRRGQQALHADSLAQSCAPTPGQPEKAPYLIPVALGLIGPEGNDFDLGDGGDDPCIAAHAAETNLCFREHSGSAGSVAPAQLLGAGRARLRVSQNRTYPAGA